METTETQVDIMQELPVDSQLDRSWSTPDRAFLVTSVDPDGNPNIIAVGWLTRANMLPPVYAIGLGKASHSATNIAATREFVLGVPGLDLARQTIYCGTHSGSAVDKFEETGLTATPAKIVQPPLIAECLYNLECKVIAVQEIQDHQVFFGEVVACWGGERQGRNLLVIGEESGYELVHEEAGFRLGAVAE